MDEPTREKNERHADCKRCGERFHGEDIHRYLEDVEVEQPDGEIKTEMHCHRCMAHPTTP